MLKTIENDVEFSTSTRVDADGNAADATFTVRTEKGAIRNVIENAVFDFTDCSRSDLVKLAMKSIVITEQSRFRMMKDTVKRDKPKTWERSHNVLAEFVNVSRAKKSQVEKANVLVDDLSPAEIADMKIRIDALKAKYDAEEAGE